MRIALFGYVVVYALAISVAILDDLKSKKAFWDTASDVVLLPLGFVGLFLYGCEAANPILKSVWKLVAPLIVIGQLVANLVGRYHYLTKKRAITQRDEVAFADIFTVVLLLPMFIANLAFAFR